MIKMRKPISKLILSLIVLWHTGRALCAGDQASNDEASNPDPTFSSHSLSLNNVGLDENDAEVDDAETSLQGPNVCTKQET